MFERKAVQSKDLAIVGYDPEKSELEVTFRAGGVYVYSNVPADIYQQLLSAPSHGTFFNKNVKDLFPAQKLR